MNSIAHYLEFKIFSGMIFTCSLGQNSKKAAKISIEKLLTCKASTCNKIFKNDYSKISEN